MRKPDRDRTPLLWGAAIIFCAVVLLRLFYLQVVRQPYYLAIAEGQRTITEKIEPERGTVYVRDITSGDEFPLATNQTLEFVFAEPANIEDVDEFIDAIKGPLKLTDEQIEELKPKLQDDVDLYEPLKRKVKPSVWEELEALELPGLRSDTESWRVYPEKELASQVIGYVGFSADGEDLVGAYGIEGYFNEELAGSMGEVFGEKDTSGRRIIVGETSYKPADDGSDLLLTIDRSIQHMAQAVLEEGVTRYGAKYGDVVVMDPTTGEILAMASAPGYNPNEYEKVEELSVFKNTAIFDTYEPGSTFKALIMAAALDAGAVDPETTFTDNGCRKVDVYSICNYDKSGPGQLTATGALERSSNVVMSQISEKVGRDKLSGYLRSFGLDALTGVALDTEAEVYLPPSDDWPDSQLATIGFGQGIATTPLRLIAALSSLANDGHLMQPHIIKEIRHQDGSTETFEPKNVGDPVKPSAALTATAMLVSAVENGVADTAQLDDYIIAGKTGTAQVAGDDGRYDGSTWITSFVGYGPVPDPRMITLIRLYDPTTSIYGANTAAPMFAELAPQILRYLRVPPNRENN